MKRLFKWVGIILLVVVALAGAVAFWLFTPESLFRPGMITKETANFVFYYAPQDKGGMEKIAAVMEDNYERLVTALQFRPEAKTNVFVYSSLRDFQRSARGPITDYLGADWFIGDNRPDSVLIVSPDVPIRSNPPDAIVVASVHEFIHMLEDRVNPALPIYLHEGIAVFLANQADKSRVTRPSSRLPDADKVFNTSTNFFTSLEFGNDDGYHLAYILVEYIVKDYGVDKLPALVRVPSHPENILGQDTQALYQGWVSYIDSNYR